MYANNNHNNYKCLSYLTMLYAAALIATQLFVHKLISFFGYDISAAVLVFPLSFTLADIITEVYGFKISRQLLWSGLLTVSFFCIIAYFIVQIPGPQNWHEQALYQKMFNPLIRIFAACFIATMVGSYINIYTISRWKFLLKGRYFWLRSIGSTLIGEAVVTLVAAPIIFLGNAPLKEIVMIATTSYIVKIVYACISAAVRESLKN